MPKETIILSFNSRKKNKSKNLPKATPSSLPKPPETIVNLGKELMIIDDFDRNYDFIRPIIQFRGITLINGKKIILDDIYFEIKKDQIFGVVGTAKVTQVILRLISTEQTKSLGKILVDGLDIDVYKLQVKPRTNLIYNNAGFWPFISIKNILQLGLWRAKNSTKVYEILNLARLWDKSRLAFARLSRLDKQLFRIATSLVDSAPIILLHQPFAGMSDTDIGVIKNVLKAVKKTGRTIIVTSEISRPMNNLCEALITIDDGKKL